MYKQFHGISKKGNVNLYMGSHTNSCFMAYLKRTCESVHGITKTNNYAPVIKNKNK